MTAEHGREKAGGAALKRTPEEGEEHTQKRIDGVFDSVPLKPLLVSIFAWLHLSQTLDESTDELSVVLSVDAVQILSHDFPEVVFSD